MKKQTFKFKHEMYSNGKSVSDGHFIAPIDHLTIAWKAPNDQTTAALIKREVFTWKNKVLSLNDCPDIQSFMHQEKEAIHELTDTLLSWRADTETTVCLYHSPVLGLIGIDATYQFLIEYVPIHTRDKFSPLFVKDCGIAIMPYTIDALNITTMKYFFAEVIK